ncbi:MAG: PIN domain-containing protein [Magnetococcales bacterium]|nr:PIN domain-containing protein [Magnetococcales bacterium]
MTGRAFVDTNLWVYALVASGDPRHALARQWLLTLPQMPVINGQVLREVGRILRVKAVIGEEALRRTMKQLHLSCQVAGDTLELHLRASFLRENHSFSYWDSLIVAAALEAGCVTLFSEDLQHGSVIDGVLSIRNPLRDG